MSKQMKIWEVSNDHEPVEMKVSKLDLEDRLEDWVEDDVSMLMSGLMIIGRQVQTDHGKAIDLLAVDENGDTTIIELKRDRTPRDVTAQALDYGSWVKSLSGERVAEIAEKYFDSKGKDSFEEEFQRQLGSEPPEIINENHQMLILATEMDSQTERIIEYLSETYGVGINALTFQYFKDSNGKEFVGRTFLVDPVEVEKRSSQRPSSKRRPNRSLEELSSIAHEKGVGDVFDATVDALQPIFFKMITTVYYASFVGKIEGKQSWILNVSTGNSPEEGLYYYYYYKRLAKFVGISEEAATRLMPDTEVFFYNGLDAVRGFLKTVDDARVLSMKIEDAKASFGDKDRSAG